MNSIVTAFAAALVASTSVTSAASIEGARDIRMYEKAAQSDVSQMPAGSLVHWQALDSQSLAVCTSNDKPWLVRVDQPCQGLMQADTVALTSRDGNVKVGTDAVELGSTQCRIATIQRGLFEDRGNPPRQYAASHPAREDRAAGPWRVMQG